VRGIDEQRKKWAMEIVAHFLQHGKDRLLSEQRTRLKKRLGCHSQQKVSQMEYGRVKSYLAYKAEEAGIAFQLVEERNTTKQCPVCGKLNPCTGRNYQCSCGFIGHRDGKTGFMVLRKAHSDLATPEFSMAHIQCVPKYRKRQNPACVVGPWRGPSSSAKPDLCKAA